MGRNGILAPSADHTRLSSEEPGGLSGHVVALVTGGGYTVDIVDLSSFTSAPSGGGSDVTFTTTYRSTGATVIGATTGGGPTPLNVGATVVVVDMTATKDGGGAGSVFTEGTYTADVVVRCE